MVDRCRNLFIRDAIVRTVPQATFAECPKCGAKVRQEKLRRHVNAVHGEGPRPAKKPVPEARAPTVRFPWTIVGVMAVAAAIVLAGLWFATRPPAGGGPTTEGSVAVIETNYGTFKVQLDRGRAPNTVNHFVGFVQAGGYNRNSFHRVAANFVIQGGAIAEAGNVAWENTGLRNVAHSVAMARSGSANNISDRDTATSQFFINLQDNPSLDDYNWPYVVFGRVIEGHSVVDAIGAIPSNPPGDGQPTTSVTIDRIYMES